MIIFIIVFYSQVRDYTKRGCATAPKRDTLPAFRNTIEGKSNLSVRCIAFLLSVIHIADSTGCFLDLLLINIHLLVGALEYTYIVVIIS